MFNNDLENDKNINRIDDKNSVKANYKIKADNRYLDVFCFPEGKIVLHGYYDYNYSFYYAEIELDGDVNFSIVIDDIFFGEWLHVYPFKKIMRSIDVYSAYRMKFILNNNKIVQYSPSVIYDYLCTIDKNEIAGQIISKNIKDIYEKTIEYEECFVEKKMIEMKKITTESDPLLFEETVLPIERELLKMQYLVFGNERVRNLYRDCILAIVNKYNIYITLIK